MPLAVPVKRFPNAMHSNSKKCSIRSFTISFGPHENREEYQLKEFTMIKRFMFLMLALSLFAVTALAQTSNTGSIVGTVSGPDGVIPGATVTVTDNQTKK